MCENKSPSQYFLVLDKFLPDICWRDWFLSHINYTMEPSKYSALSSSSSSSSSSDDSDEEIAIATLVGLYEANNGLMLEMVRGNTRKRKQWGGSVSGRKYYRRERVAGHDRLVADYFAEYPVFSPSVFRRRFRMRRDLFVRILNAIEEHNPYFVQKRCMPGTWTILPSKNDILNENARLWNAG